MSYLPAQKAIKIYIFTKNLNWFLCRPNKSATMYAKFLDNILNGNYTNIVPLHSNDVIDNIFDILQDAEKSEKSH